VTTQDRNHRMIDDHPFTQAFMHAFEIIRQDPSTRRYGLSPILPPTDQHRLHRCSVTVPSVDEIAAVIAASGNDMEVNDGRDILLRK